MGFNNYPELLVPWQQVNQTCANYAANAIFVTGEITPLINSVPWGPSNMQLPWKQNSITTVFTSIGVWDLNGVIE